MELVAGATELKEPPQPGNFNGDARAVEASTTRNKNNAEKGDLTVLPPCRDSRGRRVAESRSLPGAKP
ncbi:hypothetical protein HID58_005535 [Brassica napus]|uniref:Uncharacterized protein n=1 Tax=Brassica napus TaxID=3708 RepID=A0ABQ8E8U3_BRANA|nr:hypothetical protein HID58_005535 [Brassica napus]